MISAPFDFDRVEVRDVSRHFGRRRALAHVTMDLHAGELTGLFGPNGAGKSTLLSVLSTLMSPSGGSVTYGGRLGRDLGDGLRGRIGMLGHDLFLYADLTARENLEFFGRLYGLDDVATRARAALAAARLEDRADDRVSSFSRGMRQRLALERAILHGPRLVLLDEPFTGLDPVSADSIRGAILEMRQRGCTVILSTHDMGVAESLCDSILMIFRGKKVLDGSLASIQASYGSDTIRVEIEDGMSALANLPGIERINDMGRVQELRMAERCDPQQVLQTLAARTRVTSFSVVQPSLHDIFVRIAGPQPQEAHVV